MECSAATDIACGKQSLLLRLRGLLTDCTLSRSRLTRIAHIRRWQCSGHRPVVVSSRSFPCLARLVPLNGWRGMPARVDNRPRTCGMQRSFWARCLRLFLRLRRGGRDLP
ncbi:hypothetical protein TraAM80_09975 [Trypanosoma rangeli]|uniref:Uncharacterized protein n=1 Tax=Trypanosoma rangeli TaxID=5698 RepID=A0A3R7JVD4_TRYRA|nr:uncharacterized protein TraAM80_09975 [Trypanosoma rangeli]RNE96053.1 hypothetical protein TraAM80_09975 [Trypanosoma rangeli]|eukprot:RNE96053.1 hypothetical protein TraAM80_09975 [Trypanosoma rangeli]